VQHRPDPSDSIHSGVGPGASGHCIPIDPNYLSHNMRARLGYPFRCVEPGEEINNFLPAGLARRVQDLPNRNSKAVRGSLMPTPISCSQNDKKYDLDELARGVGTRAAPTCH
jgi:hypothetical protein